MHNMQRIGSSGKRAQHKVSEEGRGNRCNWERRKSEQDEVAVQNVHVAHKDKAESGRENKEIAYTW